jgi:hypothetical protein
MGQVAKRRSMARARVAVARKLAVILHRMWSVSPSSAGASKLWRREKTELRFLLEEGGPDVVPAGTMGEVISLRVRNRRAAMPRRSGTD